MNQKLDGVAHALRRFPDKRSIVPSVNLTKNSDPASGTRQPVWEQVGSASQLKSGVAQAKIGCSVNNIKQPITPPVYRPQPLPKVLQRKAASKQPTATQPPHAGNPPHGPTAQQKLAMKKTPPVFRPQQLPRVLQKKDSTTPKREQKQVAAIQPKSQNKPPVPISPVSKSVIQRSNLLYVSLRVGKRYEIKRAANGGKFYLYLVEEGSATPLANMRYKFYHDGSAVMEHVEAYGMPQGTRAGYLLFYIFADHAMKAGIKTVAIGTGVEEKSVNRNISEAKLSNNKKALEEAMRNMAAVHIYKELGFNATDALTLSNSSRTVQQVLTIAMQKCAGFWRIQPNYRFLIQGFRRLIAQITAPLPPDHEVFNLPNSITDKDL